VSQATPGDGRSEIEKAGALPAEVRAAMTEIGRKFGRQGGKTAAGNMTAEERSARAKTASDAAAASVRLHVWRENTRRNPPNAEGRGNAGVVRQAGARGAGAPFGESAPAIFFVIFFLVSTANRATSERTGVQSAAGRSDFYDA